MEDGECCLCACFGGRDRVFRYLAIPYRPGFWGGCGLARGDSGEFVSSGCCLHGPAYGEAMVSGKDIVFVRFAGIAEFRILSTRRPHDLPGTSAGRSLDLSSAEARNFRVYFSGGIFAWTVGRKRLRDQEIVVQHGDVEPGWAALFRDWRREHGRYRESCPVVQGDPRLDSTSMIVFF